MTVNELIEVTKKFVENTLEELPEDGRKLFYEIMKIANERDKYKAMYEAEKDLVVADELKIMELEDKHERLLHIAKKMHTWIFLNSGDEQKVYEELGLTDEENKILGYSGQIHIRVGK